jgi:poly(glycerol-phosphate) alpha-glucosyltransferase
MNVPVRWESLRAGLLTAHLKRSGGGVFTAVRQLARMLDAEPGLEVDVFGPARKADDLSEWGPLTLRTSPRVGPRFFSYAPGLTRLLVQGDLDLVHLHGLWMHPSAAASAFTRRSGKPHIVSPHGMLDTWALQNSGWKKQLAALAFERRDIASAACLHALNDAEAVSIREYGYRGPICVIPNGVEVPSESEPPPAMPWWKKAEPEKKTLLYLGRIHPKKNLVPAITAWKQVNPAIRKNWRLLIAGWSEREHQSLLQSHAANLGVSDSVTFPGSFFGEDKRAAYHHCDGVILPSLSEGLPMVLLEAWACGKAVLMTPQCNLPEGYEAGAALRIEPNAESITAGLTDFLEMDDDIRAQIGAHGRRLAMQRFSWPVITSEMASVYRWATRRAPKPGFIMAP